MNGKGFIHFHESKESQPYQLLYFLTLPLFVRGELPIACDLTLKGEIAHIFKTSIINRSFMHYFMMEISLRILKEIFMAHLNRSKR